MAELRHRVVGGDATAADTRNGEPPRRPPLEPASARDDRSPALRLEELVRCLPAEPQLDAVLRGAQGTVSRIALVYHAAYLEACGRSAPYGPIPLEIREQIAALLDEKVPYPFVYPEERRTFFKHPDKPPRALPCPNFDRKPPPSLP